MTSSRVHLGGAQTKSSLTDFKFHQRSLSSVERAHLWHYLKTELSREEFTLLRPFVPEEGLPKYGLIQKGLWALKACGLG